MYQGELNNLKYLLLHIHNIQHAYFGLRYKKNHTFLETSESGTLLISLEDYKLYSSYM